MEPVSHSDRLVAVERQYIEMLRDLSAMRKAAKRVEGSYRRLTLLLNQEAAGRKRQVDKLEHYGGWILLITVSGGFLVRSLVRGSSGSGMTSFLRCRLGGQDDRAEQDSPL